MTLPIPTDLAPMEAELGDELPKGDDWIYEPKWDGFRCLAFKDGTEVDLRSKSGKPLGRYFPDVVEAVSELRAKRCVLDGEIVIPVGGTLSFDELLLRMHPAESRVRTLVEANRAMLIVFDLLVDARGKDMTKKPLEERREALVAFAEEYLDEEGPIRLSPATDDLGTARGWLKNGRSGLDGVIAKRVDCRYLSGDRSGMTKVKRMRSADCVVGGFRWGKGSRLIGSLLLGLYDENDLLHHVGFCSAMPADLRKEATQLVRPLRGASGFTGKAPGGKSRWRREGSEEWEPVQPTLVVEVQYDHFSGGRFRHGTRFLRWRPDKEPRSCTIDQVEKEARNAVKLL